METNTNQTLPPMQTSPLNNMPPAVPTGAKIIAILNYLVSIFLIFAGIMLAAFGTWSPSSITGFLGLSFGLSLGIIPGLLVIAWGCLHFTAGRGLWMGKKWGQVLAITISGLYIAAVIINLVIFGSVNYITLLLHLVIISYLLFSKKIQAAFAYKSSKNMEIILAIIAILVYGLITAMSIKAGKLTQQFTTELDANIHRTEQAITQSGMDCKFYDSSDSAQKETPISTQSGNGTYANSVYKFQINIGQAFTLKEVRGSDYCEDGFIFFKPEDQTLTGKLFFISVKPADGDLDFIFNKKYKFDLDSIQKSNVQVASQSAFKIVRNSNANAVSFIFIYENKLYTISSVLANYTADQLRTAIASLQLTSVPIIPSTFQYFQIKEWGVEFQVPSDLADLNYVLSPSKDFISFSSQSLMDLDRQTAGNKPTYCDAKNTPVGGIAGDSQMVERFSSQYKTIGDNYFYRFVTPQAACSEDKQVQALESKIIEELKTSFQSLRKITETKN